MPCLMECDALVEMGPPPDLIVGMPPPPIPAFLRDPVALLMSSNGTCDLCGWAENNDVQLMDMPEKYPAMDDMWYFVIVSAAVGAVLFGILIFIATLRCKEAKVKPVHDPCSKVEKVQCGSMVEPLPTPPQPMALPPGVQLGSGTGPKTLWSGLKGSEGSAYSLRHHPVGPELLSHYERVDYGSVGQCRPLSPVFGTPAPIPPPLPLNPPPATCPNRQGGATVVTAVAADGVRIMGNGNAYYANPENADGSFENGGFVDSECGSLEVRRVAPDGAVVGRRACWPTPPVHGGGRGWEEVAAAASRRFELLPGSRPATCHEQVAALESRRDAFEGHGFVTPSLGQHRARVSSPLV